MIKFTIPGNPKGKGRPRFARRGEYVSAYTPPDTKAYQQHVMISYKQARQEKLEGALGIVITAHMYIPKSTSKVKKNQMLQGIIRPTKKPDNDNIEKIICDSLNGLAYDDDKQIVDSHTIKVYSENPRVEVKIFELRTLREGGGL